MSAADHALMHLGTGTRHSEAGGKLMESARGRANTVGSGSGIHRDTFGHFGTISECNGGSKLIESFKSSSAEVRKNMRDQKKGSSQPIRMGHCPGHSVSRNVVFLCKECCSSSKRHSSTTTSHQTLCHASKRSKEQGPSSHCGSVTDDWWLPRSGI